MRPRISIRRSVGLSRFFSVSRLWEKIVGNDWESSQIAPNSSEFSQNVLKCLKMSNSYASLCERTCSFFRAAAFSRNCSIIRMCLYWCRPLVHWTHLCSIIGCQLLIATTHKYTPYTQLNKRKSVTNLWTTDQATYGRTQFYYTVLHRLASSNPSKNNDEHEEWESTETK